jgi:hypothetical protein
MSIYTDIAAKFKQLSPHLDERSLRLYVAAEANAIGYGGVTLLHKITGLARSTIKSGQDELAVQERLQKMEEINGSDRTEHESMTTIRRPGGGRKKKDTQFPNWDNALEKLVDPLTRGDLESSIRWTIKSTKTLSKELNKQGFPVSPNTVMRKLHSMRYSLKYNKKDLAGVKNPDRNAQFEYINNMVNECLNNNNPVISVDTKKKEVLGNFKNNGKQWSPKGLPTLVSDHDFHDPTMPRALPFGIYDLKQNTGHVVIGTDHDTAEFATNSIYGWWEVYGASLYKDATKILITADCGGINAYRLHLWKYCLQNIVNKIKILVSVCHFPSGISKWNKIEHRLFSFISSNWRGEPLVDYETVVKLISSTKTDTGLEVSCVLDISKYQTGIKLSKTQIESINIIRDNFNGEWNYTIFPN